MIASAFSSIRGVESVLDAPCGVGRATIWLAQKSYRATGIDLGEAALEVAAEQLQAAGVDAHVEKQNILGMDCRDRAYDAVLCFRLIHHFQQRELRDQSIAELCRVADSHVAIS